MGSRGQGKDSALNRTRGPIPSDPKATAQCVNSDAGRLGDLVMGKSGDSFLQMFIYFHD